MMNDENIEIQDEKMEDLNKASMDIILHAGDARLLIMKALDMISEDDFIKAEEQLVNAHEKIKLAHKTQTKIVQADVSGSPYPHSLLFTHAQDTLMTIYSEYNITQKLIKIFKNLEHKA